MQILLTNDDGYTSPGLLALAQVLAAVGTLTVVAPDRNWSAGGHVKTLHKPLRLTPVQLADGTPAHACSGAPSDCVALVLLGALQIRPDVIVSGINPHANVGHDVTYSGTVTAAMEGCLNSIPSLAVSVEHARANAQAAAFVARLIPLAVRYGLPHGTLLNINVPDAPIRGVQITRLGERIYPDELVARHDPRGRPYYWIGGDEPHGKPLPGTDIGALAAGAISVTPLQMDMTAYAFQATLEAWGVRALADAPLT